MSNDLVALQQQWNDTYAERDRPDVATVIVAHAHRAPDAVAVVSDETTLTYRQLVASAATLAETLQRNGIGDEGVAGIAMGRSAEMVVAILGTMLSGGSFVPVDPQWPDARRESVIADARVQLLLTRPGEPVDDSLPSIEVTLSDDPDAVPPVPADDHFNGNSLAYTIFTSGSTGRPKGAMIRREAIAERMLWQRDEILHFGADDATLFKAPLAFDISLNEVLLPLVSGGRVVVARPDGERDPSYLLNLIGTQRVTFAYLVSSMLDVMLALDPQALASLRHVWCGGEVLTAALYRRFRDHLDIPLYHGYGPAEATIGVSHVIYTSHADRMGHSIGVANPNTRLYVLDDDLQVAPIGEAAELYCAGFLLGRGYTHAPGLTAGRFVADPYGPPGSRMYRTGDLVRRHDDGSLEFVGRADNQVKIRGMRLELEDVEAGVADHPDVRAVVVIATDGRLIGYVVPRDPSRAETDDAARKFANEVRDWSTTKLPEYMVPAAVITLASLPMTANSKVDRRALPAPDWDALAQAHSGDAEPVDDPTLQIVMDAMASAVGLPSCGPDADFFAIGGDSLRAITVLGALRRAGLSASVGDIFAARTPRELADRARSSQAVDEHDRPTGVIDGLPVLRWMGELSDTPGNADHTAGFIQAVELSAPTDLTLDAVHAIVSAVIAAHPALYSRMRITDTEPKNVLALDVPDSVPQMLNVVSAASGRSLDADIDDLAEHLQPSLGVMVQARLRPGALLLVIHHVAVDGVSWHILGDDLALAMQAWRDGSLDSTTLPGEGTSLRRWTHLLGESVAEDHFGPDLSYFSRALPGPDVPLIDGAATLSATVADEKTRVHRADAATTELVLTNAQTAFGANAEAVLATALALALTKWRRARGSDQTYTLVELEGHGRETRFVRGVDGVEADLSRTIGWFTTLYPAVVDPGAADLSRPDRVVDALKAVKDQLSEIPHGGIGYGALRYLSGNDELLPHRQPQVLLNYLGRVGGTGSDDAAGDFSPTGPTSQLGERRDPTQPLPRLLEFNAITEPGADGPVLTTTISWPGSALADTEINELVGWWDDALRAIGEISSRADEFTPHSVSDFALGTGIPAIIDQQFLDQIDGPGVVDVLPLTPAQQGMYFHSVFAGPASEDSGTYVEQQILHLDGYVDPDRMARAARALIRRHPALSARFLTTDSGHVVSVLDIDVADRLQYDVIELASDGAVDEVMRADRIAGMDLATAPLQRYTHVRLPGGQHRIIQTVHHLIADGWSVPMMVHDLLTLYRDDPAPGPSVPRYDRDRGFGGFVRSISSRDREDDLQPWREVVGTHAHPVVVAPGANASNTFDELAVSDVSEIPDTARERGIRLIDAVHAAWGVVLRDLTGLPPTANVLFGSTVSGRDLDVDGLADAVGMVINTIPARADGVPPNQTAASMISAAERTSLLVRDRQHVGLGDIAKATKTVATELFDTLVVADMPLDPAAVTPSGLPFEITGVVNDGAPHYPLTLVVAPEADELLRLIYDTTLISDVRAHRIASRVRTALTGVLGDATAGEVASQVSAVGSVSAHDDSMPQTLAQMWQATVREHPSRPALRVAGVESAAAPQTYGDVDRAARFLAADIGEVQKETSRTGRIALLMERAQQPTAMIATVLLGATYVPLDPYSPRDRLSLIVQDCVPDVIVCSPEYAGLARELAGDAQRVFEVDPALVRTGEAPAIDASEPNREAYILYTSGSTGRPKGVVVTHQNVMALQASADQHFGFSRDDVWLVFHSFAFDFSVWEFWTPLRYGAQAVIADHALTRSPEDVAAALNRHEITVLNQTPTAFAALDAVGATAPSLRYLIFGGEALDPSTLHGWRARHSDARAINMYGITETTVHVTFAEVADGISHSGHSPIGHPLSGLRGYVLDEFLTPVAVGETGILYVSGPQVTDGYLGLPGTTATRFVADPFTGQRMYCSGDVVRVRRDGSLDYLNRADRQVQVRGFRIEPGEIEAALCSVEGVASAAVVAVGDGADARLGAVLTASQPNGQIAASARRAARELLPAYMVPDVVTQVAAIPTTVNGKRDEPALVALLAQASEPEDVSATATTTDAPSTSVGIISDAIAAALDRESVLPDDDFFRLGGDSILAIRVAHRAAGRGISLTPRDIFMHRTARAIARELTPAEAAPQSTDVAPTGPMVPTPMLLRQKGIGWHKEFVQARRFGFDRRIGADELRAAVDAIVQAHPALRMQVQGTGRHEALVVTVAASAPEVHVGTSADVAALTRHIDPSQGAMVAAAVDDDPTVVVMVIHHAAVDSASWIVIEDDLRDALAGRDIAPESTSVKEFAQALMTWAQLPDAAIALSHWTQLHDATPLVDGPISAEAVDIGDAGVLNLDHAAHALGVQVTDVCAGLVVAAVARVIGERSTLLLDVERHGRPSRDGALAMDCTRTVGWFTEIAPIAVPGTEDPFRTIAAAAEPPVSDRATYPALRYLNAQTAPMLTGGAQLVVNYLGRGESETVVPTDDPTAAMDNPYAVEVNIWGHEDGMRAHLRIARSALDEWGVDPDRVLDRWRSVVAEVAAHVDSERELRHQRVPLTVLQRGLLFQSQMSGSGVYSAQTYYEFDRQLDAEQVAQAYADAVVVHHAMGARFIVDGDGNSVQALPSPKDRVLLPVQVCTSDDTSEIADRDLQQPFDVELAPLARGTIVRRSVGGDVLLLTYSLVLLDGWSRARFLETFLECLNQREAGQEPALQPSLPAFGDIAFEMDRRDASGDVAYWRDALAGVPGPTLLADRASDGLDNPGAPTQIHLDFGADETSKLLAVAAERGVTMTAMITAAMGLTLGSAAGEVDTVFGLSVSGRNLVPGGDSVVGVLLNTVPVRVAMAASDSVAEVLRRVHDNRADALPHDAADLGQVQQAVGYERLFDSLVVVQNFLELDEAQQIRDRYGITAEDSEDSTHFPLTWVFTPGADLHVKLEYRPELITDELAKLLATSAVQTLQALVDADESTPVSSLASAGVAPTVDIVEAVQNPALGQRTVVHELLAASEGDRTAVVCGDQRWTAQQLVARCAGAAQALADLDIGPGSTVAIAMERSADVVAAIFAVLWSGARYVPVDLEHPDPRLSGILDDCAPDAVVVSSKTHERMAQLSRSTTIVFDTIAGVDADPTQVPIRAEQRSDAYIIYTSGSTGKPKGVVVAHDGLTNMLHNHRERIFAPAIAVAGNARDTAPIMRVAHAISFAFDMSWEELLWLTEGHEVHICDEELRRDAVALAEYVREAKIDVINVTPSQAEQLVVEGLLDSDRHQPPLVLLGGEAVSASLWDRLASAPGVRGYNLYGPTEYTINALGAGTDESTSPVVGQPIDNTAALILDRWLRPVPQGVAGELYLTGVGLARCYHQMPRQTASSMVTCPFGAPGERMYRTGDRVRQRRRDGHIEYLGRTDDQVKIRGHRVDPGEVSAAVRTEFGDQVHAVHTVADGGVLVCHVAAPSGTDELLQQIRSYLLVSLPDYLVPLRYSLVRELPLTVNGKVDVAALGSGEMIVDAGRAPATEEEELVAELVAETLDMDDDVAGDADFFAVGGHSMAAVRLVSLLHAECGVKLSVREVYQLRTVDRIAERIGGGT